MRWWILIMVIGYSSAWADTSDDHAIGWHWYNEPQEKPQQVPSPIAEDPVKQVALMRDEIKLALDKAILNPTDANVAAYIAMQNKLSEQSTRFAKRWKDALFAHPDLNDALVHPTTQVGLTVYREQQNQLHQDQLQEFANHNGLFFFYKGNCPYCQRFAPILQHFAKRHHFHVVPVTLDGQTLPEYPNPHLNQGQAQQFKVKVTPSVFSVNPYTGKAFPIAYGLTTENELEDRIIQIMEESDHV